MTSTTNKLWNYFFKNFAEDDAQYVEKINNEWLSISNKWYYFLLPKRVRVLIIEILPFLNMLHTMRTYYSKELCSLAVELATYKHNSIAQKAKNKKYSQLRYKQHLENSTRTPDGVLLKDKKAALERHHGQE